MVHRGRGANKFRGGGDASGRGGGGGGRGNRGGRGRGGGRGGFFRMAGDEKHSFSLADEAKNTERHHGNYAGGSLRHVKISFVAAGHLEPADLLKPLNANIPPVEEGQNLMQPRAQRTTSDSTEAEDEDFDMQNGESDSPAEPTATGDLQEDLDMEKLDLDPPSEKPFVVDVVGDPSLKPKGKSIFTMPIYSPAREISPERPGSSSSSSSERIVFIPRKMRPGLSRTGTNLSISQEPASSASKQKKTPTPLKREPTPPPKEPTPPAVEVKVIETVVSHTTITTVNDKLPVAPTIDSKPFTRSTKGNKRRSARQRKKDEEEEIIRDYIENVAATMRAEDAEDAEERGEAAPAVSVRELGGDDDPEDAWSSATDSEEEAEDSDAVNAYKSIWSEHELEDFDALSTASEGPRGPVKIVIGKRKRPSGVQYLIKWEGYETDDATWVLAETLDSAADAKIAVYEKILMQKATDAANAAASSEDSDDGSDDYDEDDDEDLDEDEKLARFLQHQEEMGITESDLELNLELDELMELSFPGGGGGGSSKKKAKGKGKSRYADIVLDRRTGRFPSATRFAEAYDDFDPMDWERPSLSTKKGKGKKGKGKQIEVLGISDSEIEENIRNTWQKDREKKKARKQEREALRAEGLLGRNRTVRDPKAKWKEGMSSGDLRDEITQFLLSELSSIALPPMSKPDRKIAHTIAAAFGLKSKSAGKARARYTTLYKTSTSGRFAQDEDAINDLMAKKRFFGRPDVHTGRGGRGGGGGRGCGGAGGVVHHREGDIVGGSAPEIAEDNKGRRMLEKMGYRTGMALGIDGNKGIVVPVAAIVKISKAGLG